MAAIERTAYPRFKRHPTAEELTTLYTPSPEELAWATGIARTEGLRLALLAALKAFQRLGYFPPLAAIPAPILQHLRTVLRVAPAVPLAYDEPRTRDRHRQLIRDHLAVQPFDAVARHLAANAVLGAAAAMDHPADLINVALEVLIKARRELPAFSSLDRLVRRVRHLVNQRASAQVAQRCAPALREQLDALLLVAPAARHSGYQRLKESPKRPTLRHLQALLDRLAWVAPLADTPALPAGLPAAKIPHFAAEAKALDAAEMRKISAPKRTMLLLCLLHQASVQGIDDLATMFCKRIATIHRRGREALEAVRVRHRAKTEALVTVLADVLGVVSDAPSDAEVGRRVRALLAPRGGNQPLLDDCAALAAYHGDNYLPLLWPLYRGHRPTLFRLARLLEFVPRARTARSSRPWPGSSRTSGSAVNGWTAISTCRLRRSAGNRP